MLCPKCGTADAYQGLTKISCKNSSCEYGTPVAAPANSSLLVDQDALKKITNNTSRGYSISGKAKIKNNLVASKSGRPSDNWFGYPHDVLSQKALSEDILYQTYICAYKYSPLVMYGELCVIAGGSVISWSESRVANDVDIFCRQSFVPIDLQKHLIKELKCNVDIHVVKPSSKYKFSAIKEVWEAIIKDQLFQWIILDEVWLQSNFPNSPNNPIRSFVEETFDIGICKALIYGSDPRISIYTKDCSDDLSNMTLTVSLSKLQMYDRLKSLPKRSRKYQAKFPNHKIVINP